MQTALTSSEPGFEVVRKDNRLFVRIDLGRGSYIDSDVCIFCEKEMSQIALKSILEEESADTNDKKQCP
jgi:hypothetical protein